MSHSAAERTILYEEGGAPRACNLVLEQLNDRFQNTLDDMYFTMVYGIIDVSKQIVEFSQGGHPNPICISAGRRGGTVGVGGFPVGMLAPMEYDQSRISFHPGDRLFVYSDGIIECTNKRDEAFGVARLVSVLEASASETLQHQVDRVKNALWEWRGSEEFEDDLSLLAFQAL
jgi:sigma-B regulation protein RsbU (phosphoserine phosphatase)